MRLIEKTVLEDKVYLIPLGDLHLGSPNIDWDKFIGYIDWVKEHSTAYIFLMGDIFDTAVINGATNIFTQTMSLNSAMETFYNTIFPVKDRILGAITGNHEDRLLKRANFNPLQSLCEMKDIPYCGYSCVIRFRVGRYKRKSGRVSPKVEYVFYAHHTTGGGSTPGGKLNRIDKLTKIFWGADAYLGAHNHFKAEGEPRIYYLSKSGNGKATLKAKRVHLIDTGSFVKWNNSYAEMKMLPPAETGVPRIRMDGKRKDLHVSY